MSLTLRQLVRPVGDGPAPAPAPADVLDGGTTVEALLARDDLDALLANGAWVADGGEIVGRLDAAEIVRALAIQVDAAQRERDAVRRALAAESVSRNSFFANLSHELRTPLNAIVGYAELIRSEVLGPITPTPYGDYLCAIQESSEHLMAMVDAVLDMAKIRANEMELRETLVELPPLFAQIRRMMEPLARRRRVTIVLETSASLPKLHADERVLRQILANLVCNAIKYTYSGTVVTLAARQTASGHVQFTVSDRGPGIPPEQLSLVMQPFKQLENASCGALRSTGLGLPLVKALTELHDGEFVLRSRQGKGTRATVTIPRARVRGGRVCFPQGEFEFRRSGQELRR